MARTAEEVCMGDKLCSIWKGMQRSWKGERSYRQGRHLISPTDTMNMV